MRTLGIAILRTIKTAIYLFFAWLLYSTADGAEKKLYVKEARFSELVDRTSRECGTRWIDASKISKFGAPTLFLWTRLAGDQVAFEQLKEKKKLPIKHIWKFQGPLDPEQFDADTDQDALADQEAPTYSRQKPIAVGNIRDLPALLFELATNGFFGWRTWSHRFNLSSGIYTVEVRYADDTPVTDGEHPSLFTVRYIRTR